VNRQTGSCYHGWFQHWLGNTSAGAVLANNKVCYAPTSRCLSSYTLSLKGAFRLLAGFDLLPLISVSDFQVNYLLREQHMRGYWWAGTPFSNTLAEGQASSLNAK
jgi:hypothetical protein